MNFVRKTRVGHNENVLALHVNSDRVLSSVAEDGHCILWSSDGKIIRDINVNQVVNNSQLPSDECPLNSVTFSPADGNQLYISLGMQVVAYDMRNCSTFVNKFNFNEEEINQICVNSSGQYLAACDDRGEIRVIDIKESRLFKTLRKHHSNICASVQFRHKKCWQILSAGLDSNIINWDFSSGKPEQIFNVNDFVSKETEGNQTFINPPFVHSLSVGKDGKHFATGLGNGDIGLFQFQGKLFKCTEKLRGHDSEVSQVYHFNIDNSMECLVSGGNDCKINIWKKQTGKNIKYDLHHKICHDSKINWITCTSFENACIYVADQSSNVTVYEIIK